MKNQRIFSLVGFTFVLFLIMGCEKEPSGEPTTENPNIKPTISVDMIPEDGIVDFDGSVTFSFVVSVNTKKMTINGEDVSLPISTYVVPNVKTNTTFVFIVENDAGRTVRTKNIVVRDQVFSPPTITLTANPDTLPIGGGITTLSWSSDADSVLINNVWYEPNGLTEIGFDSTSEISALAKGKGGETTKTVTISVLLPPTMEDFLCSGTWTLVQLEFCDSIGNDCYVFWDWESALPCEQDDQMTFTQNPNNWNLNYNFNCEGQNNTPYNCPWSLDGDYIVRQGIQNLWTIGILTPNLLVYTYPSSNSNDEPIKVKCTYKHLQ